MNKAPSGASKVSEAIIQENPSSNDAVQMPNHLQALGRVGRFERVCIGNVRAQYFDSAVAADLKDPIDEPALVIARLLCTQERVTRKFGTRQVRGQRRSQRRGGRCVVTDVDSKGVVVQHRVQSGNALIAALIDYRVAAWGAFSWRLQRAEGVLAYTVGNNGREV